MLPIHTILHPTDFSEFSDRALRLACALARDYGAKLVVLHSEVPTTIYADAAVPIDPEEQYVQSRMQLADMEISESGLRIERRFEEGDPASTILRLAKELPADLIIMGTHGRTGLVRLLMGSVAELVVRRSECPVLTVKTPFLESIPVAQAVATARLPEPAVA